MKGTSTISYTNLLISKNIFHFGFNSNHYSACALEDGDDSIKASDKDCKEEDDDGSIYDNEEGGDEIVEVKKQLDRFLLGTLPPWVHVIRKTTRKQQQQYLMRSLIITRATSCLSMAELTKQIEKVTKFLPLEITALINQLFVASSPFITQTRDLNMLLRDYATTGGKFFVQADGSAKHPPTNGAYSGVPGSGERFCMPQDGTVLRAKPVSGYPDVIFRSNDFVHVTHLGLIDCTVKSKPCKGMNMTMKAVRFSKYKYMNTSCVVEV